MPRAGGRAGRAAANARRSRSTGAITSAASPSAGSFAGKIRKGQRIALLKHDGRRVDDNVAQLYTFDRLGRTETNEVDAGDICAVVGLEDVDIGDTIADFDNPVALPPIKVDEPTLDMIFRINDSPFCRPGRASTSPAGSCATG